MTSNSKAQGRYGKQDFRYVAAEDLRKTSVSDALSSDAKALADSVIGVLPKK